jgi:hypothetical protein
MGSKMRYERTIVAIWTETRGLELAVRLEVLLAAKENRKADWGALGRVARIERHTEHGERLCQVCFQLRIVRVSPGRLLRAKCVLGYAFSTRLAASQAGFVIIYTFGHLWLNLSRMRGARRRRNKLILCFEFAPSSRPFATRAGL